MKLPDEVIEAAILDAYNRFRKKHHMSTVDYIGANNTPECNAIREEVRENILAFLEAMKASGDAREGFGVMDGSGPEWEVLSGDSLHRGGFPVIILRVQP